MNKTIQPARDRERDIMNRAASVMAMTVDPTTDAAGNMIADNAVMMENLDKAVQKVPMFEGVPPEAARQIAGGWAMSLHEYKRQNGHYPASDVLANAHRALERLMTECASNTHEGSGKAMFESVAESMRTSDGVMKVAQYAALILPASLGAATSDACTFVPCERDESHIYELLNVAGTKFGSFQQGDELDMQSAGVYSQMKRLYTLTEKGDNSKTTFTFDIKKFEGQACPIRQGYNKLLINRKPSKVDDGDGNLYFNDRDTKGNAFSATAKVKYDTGVIDITFTDAPAEGTEIAVQVEINVERNPGLIPVINQAMRKYTVRPSQYVIASEHTVMAASDLSREHGLELAALQFSAMRNWISHETDIMRLRTLVFHTVYGREFDVAMPEAQSYESWVGLLRHAVNALSQDMANRTKTTGIRGGFAGADAANFLRSLPPQHFQIAPGYVQSPYVQYIGTLFGSIRIYEVPQPVCEQFGKQGYEFGLDDIFFYGRGEGIGKAGLIAGDAVPAIPYVHETNPSLVNRTTLWGTAINEVHPRNGENYFARLRLTRSKEGAIDMLTGQINEKK
ncbi:TPA: capsid protein [Salmonella enterica subsp. enterica serovar Typhimurium]|uniref:capsid protein n=1 Tax=Salmonella enterica TaxID=28901 RepID=UPI0018EA1604|nr:capsid protein [Salmonella enterica subsp. enterica serovar Typhimurium]MBJ5946102.1 capsid protein [Salmonella enterica subsp. enterica serovar Derby]MCL9430774.1 capsid protein [Salmonella enterica subsp. enterica serovar Enteritidis]MCY5487589.1 capsid protein [Salmonella enterica subsp. enterica serovar 1,4,[5],12:i:-]MDJ1789916.1 capsid protein [Salmonella enterica]HEA1397763.1 capsid protein [Escherichia coli]